MSERVKLLEDCPKCGGAAQYELSDNKNQIWVQCSKCGYRVSKLSSTISFWYCAADYEAEYWNSRVKGGNHIAEIGS